MYTLYCLLFNTVYIKIIQSVSHHVTVRPQELNYLLHELRVFILINFFCLCNK